MDATITATIDTPFEVLGTNHSAGPFIFNSPHSGRLYPESFIEQSRLEIKALRRSEDSWVDLLFDHIPDYGQTLMKVHFPRAFIDVNREAYELDPRMFDGRLPPFTNTRSVRVAGGLGTIPRLVSEAQEIYKHKLTVTEALARIETYYKPYHRALKQLLLNTRRKHGVAVLIDCHSMPSHTGHGERRREHDIVLGDRHGTSCAPIITDMIETMLTQQGYMVQQNKPYAGGFITEHYGNPAIGVHSIQLEVNRGLYMDERLGRRIEGFDKLRRDMMAMVETLLALTAHDIAPWQAAAE